MIALVIRLIHAFGWRLFGARFRAEIAADLEAYETSDYLPETRRREP